MRIVLAIALLGMLSACAMQPSTGEQAFLSRHQAQVNADVQAIMQGMEHARSASERLARYGR